MLVTVPLVLLLLDFWPLGRLSDIKRRSAIALPRTIGDRAFQAARLAIAPSTPRSAISPSAAARVFLRDVVAIDDRGFVPPGGRKGSASPSCRGRRLDDPFRPRHDIVVQPDVLLACRIGNALIAYVGYLNRFFCPWGLALEPRRTACPVALGGSRVRRPIDCRHGSRSSFRWAPFCPLGLGSARP